MWWLVASGGYDCWVETMRPRRREGETVRLRGREGERETMRTEREDENNKNKKRIKNYKEIIFK